MKSGVYGQCFRWGVDFSDENEENVTLKTPGVRPLYGGCNYSDGSSVLAPHHTERGIRMSRHIRGSDDPCRLDNMKVIPARLAGAVVGVLLVVSASTDDARSQDFPEPPMHATADTLVIWPDDSPPTTVIADTLNVERRRLGMREIIERCIEGQRTRLGGHDDMTCTTTIRAAVYWKKKKEITNIVYRSYSDVQERTRSVQLDERTTRYKLDEGEWIIDTDRDEDDDATVRAESDGYSEFTELPVFLEELGEYDFELLERIIEVDHVIFKIAFRPKSEFKPLPSGVVYVDTNNYRIIHEEYDFEQNPFPLFLKDMKRITRHWAQLPGGEWVFTRLMMEVDLRSDPFGWIPDRVAIALVRDDFEFDQGYDARVFGE